MAAPALNSLIVKPSVDAFENTLKAFRNMLELLGGSTLPDIVKASGALSGLAATTLAVERLLLNGLFLSYITSLFGEMGDSVVVGIDPLDDLVFSTLRPELQKRILQAQLGGFSSESYVLAVASVGSLNSSEMNWLAKHCDRGEYARKPVEKSFISWGEDPAKPGRPVDIIPSTLSLIGYQLSSDESFFSGLLCRGEKDKLYLLEFEGDGSACRIVQDGGPFPEGSQAIMDLRVTIERPGAAFRRRVGGLFRSWVAARERYEKDSGRDMSDGTSTSGEISVFGNDGFAVLLRSINSLEKALLAASARFVSLEWPSRGAIRSVTLGREQSIFAEQEGLLNLEHSRDRLVRDASALFSGVGSVFSGGELCSTSTSMAIEAARDIQEHLWDAFPGDNKKEMKDNEFNPALAFLADRMDLNLPESAGWLASRASQYSRVSFKGGSGLLIPTSGKWLLFSDDTAGFPTPRLLPFQCIKVSRQVSLLPKAAQALGIPLNNDAMNCVLSEVRSDGRNVLTLLTRVFPEALRFIAPATKVEPVSFSAIFARCRQFEGDGDLVACMTATAIGASSPAYVGGGRFRCYFDTVSSLGRWPGTGYHLIADKPVPCPELIVYVGSAISSTVDSVAGSLYADLAPGYIQHGENERLIEIERGTIEPEDWVVYDRESAIRTGRSGPSPPGVAHMRFNRLDRKEELDTTMISVRVGLKP